MHQVAQRYSKRISNGHFTERKIRVACLFANTLDSELLTEKISSQPGIEVPIATADVDFCVARCQSVRPKLLIVDHKVVTNVVQLAHDILREEAVEHVLLLDDRLHEGLLLKVLKVPHLSYVTRHVGIRTLLALITQLSSQGKRVFDPLVQHRIQKSGNSLRLEYSGNGRSVTCLTARELQVMELLAQGHSVRACAHHLELADSTVDNHKSRLMKKLELHKIVELTHAAIREGLVVVV